MAGGSPERPMQRAAAAPVRLHVLAKYRTIPTHASLRHYAPMRELFHISGFGTSAVREPLAQILTGYRDASEREAKRQLGQAVDAGHALEDGLSGQLELADIAGQELEALLKLGAG